MGSSDQVADALASFVCEARPDLPTETISFAKLVLLDSLAVALGALEHPAAQAARSYAQLFPAQSAASTIWGTSIRVTPETAALVNGVPLRGYDFNDLYMGRNEGHPSDIIPGVVAAAEWNGASGHDVLRALAIGYEIALHLLDTINVSKAGWDYVNLTSIAGTCAIGSVLRLSQRQLAEALAITVIPHAASIEVESGKLNKRGDLTMWKRFNGSDAIRQSVYACLLASAGVEGAVDAFVGAHGFLKLLNTADDAMPRLLERLTERGPLQRITQVTLKRWPVGSRAQSAIQSALEVRSQVKDIAAIREVRVSTQEGVYHHLVRSRKDPWHPFSRETADHSLPYIVAAALIDGVVNPNSFTVEKVQDAARQALLDKVKVRVAPEVETGNPGAFLSKVDIELASGEVIEGRAVLAAGHPTHPFQERDVLDKLRENTAHLFNKVEIDALTAAVRSLDTASSVGDLVSALTRPTG